MSVNIQALVRLRNLAKKAKSSGKGKEGISEDSLRQIAKDFGLSRKKINEGLDEVWKMR